MAIVNNANSPRPGDTENALLRKILMVLGGIPNPGDTDEEITAKIINTLQSSITGTSGLLLKVNKSGDTMTGPLVFAQNTLSASSPSIQDSQTWNNAGAAFTGWTLNVTNTASDSNSNLYNFQVGGEDRANFTVGGVARFVRHTADNSSMALFLRKRGQTGNVDGAIASDASLFSISASGWDGTAFFTGAQIQTLAEENWSGTVAGTRITFQTTTPGGKVSANALILRSTKATFSGDVELPVGSSLKLTSGANQRAGNTALVGGTKAVANTTVTANTVAILTQKTAGGTPGTLSYTLSAGVGFTINSTSGTDTSTVSYLLVEVP